MHNRWNGGCAMTTGWSKSTLPCHRCHEKGCKICQYFNELGNGAQLHDAKLGLQLYVAHQNLESLAPGERVYLSATLEMKCHKKVSEFVSEQFRLFFMGFSKAINKQQQRTGSLFQKNFKRLVVKDDAHFGNLLYYIHANAQLHGICSDFREYPYSSFPAYLSNAVSNLKREEVVAWYGSAEAMIKAHHPQLAFEHIEALMIEDD